MKVKIKKLSKEAIIPNYAKEGDAGMDFYCDWITINNGKLIHGTGISIEIPKGFVGLLFPRSSVSKKDLILSNCVGVIDSGYRGEITFVYKPLSGKYEKGITEYQIGDRIGQLIIMPYPEIEFEEVEELSKSERGTGGYGSTGN